MNRAEQIAAVKRQMTWIKDIKMDRMRRADQAYGMMLGAVMILQMNEEEFQDMTEFWENLRKEIMWGER